MDFRNLTDAELNKVRQTGTWREQNASRDEQYRRIECEQKRGREIGDVIDFVRYGDPVENSFNHRDGTSECGMSVYMLDGAEIVHVGFWFDIASRPAYRGTGVIVGWGSDGEPLVRSNRCERDASLDRSESK